MRRLFLVVSRDRGYMFLVDLLGVVEVMSKFFVLIRFNFGFFEISYGIEIMVY